MDSPLVTPAQEALNNFLIDSITIDEVALGQSHDGTLVLQVPDIVRDSALFTFPDKDSARALFELAVAADGVKLDIHVGTIGFAGKPVTYAVFRVDMERLNMPEDARLVSFFQGLGNMVAANTTIRSRQ